jgi:hypothetical protein
MPQDVEHHGGGGALPGRAAHRNGAVPFRHQGEKLAPLQHGDAHVQGLAVFRDGDLDGGRYDDAVDARGDAIAVLGVAADAHPLQPPAVVIRPAGLEAAVRAGHLTAQPVQELRKCAHARAGDADEEESAVCVDAGWCAHG